MNNNVAKRDIGLLSPGICQHVQGALIDKCREAGHRAVQHGSENENMGFPQTFEKRNYPTWDQKGNAAELFGPIGVWQGFKTTLLTDHCCVAINPWWLTLYFHKNMNKDSELEGPEPQNHAQEWRNLWAE